VKTLPRLLVERAGRTPNAVALRKKDLGIWRELTWADYLARVKHLSLGLRSLGLAAGDRMAIIGDNRAEWFIAELAAHAAGAASVGLFQDATASEVHYVLDHADARFLIAEDQEQVDKVLEIKDALPRLEFILWCDPRGMRSYSQPWLLPLADVEARGQAIHLAQPRAFDRAVAAGRAEDLAILCYTSGTTGRPKGAMLSHANLTAAVENLLAVDPIEPGDEYVSFLPCGWIAEQALAVTGSLISGLVVNFPEEPETVRLDLREIGPSLMMAAPRIWENLVSEVVVNTLDAGWLKRHIYDWGMGVGQRFLDDAAPSAWLRAQHALAERLVFFPLRDQLGLRHLKRAYSGGAALGPDSLRFFRALGVNLKQVYGQTEIGGLSVVHRDGLVNAETVGQPIAGTEIRISDAGEILSRSDGLFLGYYKDPAATHAALRGGWLHSGDAGFFDRRGELVVLDRLSDVMRRADGTTFAPQYIENKLKFSAYVKEAVALGHEQPYVAAMVNIDLANVGKWAETHGLSYTTYTDLAQKPAVYDLIAGEVRRANASLPEAARVERFVLLHKELDADDEEMTRTRKLRRTVIAARYGDIIGALYDPRLEKFRVVTDVQYQDGRRGRIQAQLKLYTVGDRDGLPVAA
jgi:long-chain acyl-CoA synthetase